VALTHVQQYDMPGLLRAALVSGDTRYRKVPLFTLALPGASQDLGQRKGQLSRLHSGMLENAGVIMDKNTHIWRNYSDSTLANHG
jgi:hypothetical protein